MPTWLTTDPAQIWPTADQPTIDRIKRWIGQAERLIQNRFPTINERIDNGTLDPLAIADIVEAMVDRALARRERAGLSKLAYPEVQMEWDDSGGAGQGSWIFLTLDELMVLTPPQATGASSVRMPVREQRLPW